MGYLRGFQWLFEMRNSREIVGVFLVEEDDQTRSNYTHE